MDVPLQHRLLLTHQVPRALMIHILKRQKVALLSYQVAVCLVVEDLSLGSNDVGVIPSSALPWHPVSQLSRL